MDMIFFLSCFQRDFLGFQLCFKVIAKVKALPDIIECHVLPLSTLIIVRAGVGQPDVQFVAFFPELDTDGS